MTDDGALFALSAEDVKKQAARKAEAEKEIATKRAAEDRRLITNKKHPISRSAGYSIPLHAEVVAALQTRELKPDPTEGEPKGRCCGDCGFLTDQHVSGQLRCIWWGGSAKSVAASIDKAWPGCAAHRYKKAQAQ